MKRNKVLFVIAIVAMLAVLFVACDDSQNTHTHTYGAWTIATAPTETEEGTVTRVCSCGDVETATVAKLSDASVWSVKTSQDATHTSKGYKVYESAYGTVTIEVAKGEHAYGAWTITTEPTVTEAGKAIRVCVCGSYEEVALAVLTDTSVWTKKEKQAQSHTEDGIVEYTSEYGKVTVTTAKAGHTYGAWTISTEPTETEAGVVTRTCSCGDEQTQPVAKLTDASVWTVSVNQESSHTQGGVKVYTSEYGTIIKASAQGTHTFGGWEITTDPTETATGVAKRYCSCGFFEQVTIPALSNSVWTRGENSATHFEPGRVTYTSEYGTVTIITEVQQHVYGPWKSNGNGTHTHKCVSDDYEETKDCAFNQQVTTAAYLAEEATCDSPAKYYYSCVCGTKSEHTFTYGGALGHNYDNFQVTDATCTEDGAITATCTRDGCGHVYNKTIEKLGHDHDGGCIPYENKTMDEETHEDGSEHHVYRCSRCGAYDTANVEEHMFSENPVEYVLAPSSEGWHSVNAVYVCEDCGRTNIETNAFSGQFIEQTDYYTKGDVKEADYNESGYVEYTHKATNTTFRIVEPKLTAPYEGVTYYAYELSQKGETSFVKVGSYAANVTFDENGTGVGDYSPFMGDCTIRIIDKNSGEVTFTRVDSGSTYNDRGYIDLSTGIVITTKDSVYDSVYFMIPEKYNIKAGDIGGAVWTDSMAISYDAVCAYEFKHGFNFFVYDETVYFGAKYFDAEGNEIKGADCATANYVKAVDAQDGKIQTFARNASGALQVTDGLEGSYTDSTYNAVVLNGVGGATIDGKAGVYFKEADKEYYELYVGESVETATEYYTFTLVNGAISVKKPTATLVFKGDDVSIDDMVVSVNILTNLPEPTVAGKVFRGWKLDGEGERMTSFKATSESEYTFEVSWAIANQLTVKDLLADDEAGYGTKVIGYGDTYVSALPNYEYQKTFNEGYTFVGWVLDTNGNGTLDDNDEDIQDNDVVTAEGANLVVFATWEWAGNVTFSEAGTYTFVYDEVNGYWKSNNQGMHGKTAAMEFFAAEGIVHVSFEYKCSSESWDKLTIWYGPSNKSVTVSGTSDDSWKTIETTLDFSIDDSNQKVRFSYSKDSSGDKGDDTAYIRNLRINGVLVTAQNALFKNSGTYTNAGNEIQVSKGGMLTIGDNNYGYTIISDTVIGATIGGVYKEFALNTTAKTYTETEPKVTVSYNYNGHGTNSSEQVGKYSNQTLSTDVPTAEGFVFRGWYTDAELTTEAPATFVASADVTFYAKWDAAVTLAYNYLDGTTADFVENYYANDKVTTLKAVDFKFGTKVFAGWFTKDGSETGDYGTEFVADTVITKTTTVYAKWVEPSVFAGSYSIVYLNGSGVSSVYSIDVDAFGSSKINSYNGFNYGYTVSFAFAEGSTSTVIITATKDGSSSKYYGVYDATTGVIVRADNANGFSSNVYMMVPYDSSYAKSDFTAFAWSENSKYHKLVSFADKTADNAVRTFFVADSNTVAFDATWTAVKANDEAITSLADVKTDADQLTVVCGGTTYKFAKNNSNNFVVTDGNEGTYTSGSDSVRLNGAGKITGTFNGAAISGTYTAAASDAGYGFDVKTSDNKATYTLSINKDDNTYTMAENRVTITYVNDKVTVASASVFRNVSTTLYAGDDLTTVDGFKFRGWFDNAEYSGSAKTSVTPTGDVTFYAKYDAAVTLTFDYSGYEYESGKTTYVVPDKFANDTIDTLPTVDASVRHEEKAFAGWFYKNEDGSFGNQATPSDKLSGNTTVYAKWVDAPKSYGTFKGFEIWNAKSDSKTSLSTEVLKVAVNGSFTGVRSISGTLSETDAAIANGAINVGRYAYLSDALGGIVIVGYNSSDTSVGADFYIGFRNYANITSVDYSVDTIGGGYVAFLTVNYSENGTAKSMNLLVFKDRIYADVAWASGVTAKNAATTDSFLITDASGNVIAKKSGSEMLGNDGKGGAYNNTDAYGEIALDGYGTLTVGGQQVAYTLDGNKVTFVIDNTMRVITLGDGVYTKTLDGYEGTYTLPDASTLALDGYGNVTDTSKTYVVSGNNITIYDGETSVKYGLDVDNKALLGKSVFAGYKFSGDSMSITFDDSSSISGTILNGTTYSGVTLKFTATFDGTTLTITIANANGVSWNNGSTWTSNSDFDGKTIVMKLSGNELSVVSSTTTSLGYSFNDKAVTCEGFSR